MGKELKQKQWIYHSKNRKFEKSIDRKLLAVILILTIAVIGFILLGKNLLKNGLEWILDFSGKDIEDTLNRMCEEASFLGNAVWTLTTILAAFMVLHYSSMGSSTYGVKNRKIIAYTCGTYFIPGLIIFNILIVMCMTFAYYEKSYAAFYLLALYSILLQLMLIIGSIFLTSQKVCFRVIMFVEKKQFHKLCKAVQDNKCVYEKFGILPTRKELMIYHTDMILRGQDTLTEKFEIIQEILKIPFHEEYQEVLSCLHGIYYYLYRNMQLTVTYISKHLEDRQKLYTTFYKNIEDAWRQYKKFQESDEKQKNQKVKILLYMGAFFHTVMPEERLEERWECINFAVGLLGESFFRRVVIAELFMSLYDLWRKEQISFNDKEENERVENFLKNQLTRDTGCSINAIKANMDKIKEELQEIVYSWNMDTTMDRSFQYERAIEILECFDENEEDDYIHYLLRHMEG